MKVALYYPTLLPPKDYGGIERVVLWLARGLQELGHDVSVIALKGSRLPAGVKLISLEQRDHSVQELLDRLPPGLDVLHFNSPPGAELWAALSCPALLTVHGNGKPDEVFPENSVFISRDHAERHSGEVYVYNGIDPAEYEFAPDRKKDAYLFLSKTSWRVKNVKGAIELCRRAGVPLRVAGGKRPLAQRLRVTLTPGMNWEGPVNGERKARLLSEAKALVFPVKWAEPFGLVMAEALISGTPVIASRKGSVPELIPAHVGAVLSAPGEDDSAEGKWIELLSQERLPWRPEDCRNWALEKFHYRVMAENYVRLYQRVSAGERLHASPPRTLLQETLKENRK